MELCFFHTTHLSIETPTLTLLLFQLIKHFLGQKICVRVQTKHGDYMIPLGDRFLHFIQYKEKFLEGLPTADYTPIKSVA